MCDVFVNIKGPSDGTGTRDARVRWLRLVNIRSLVGGSTGRDQALEASVSRSSMNEPFSSWSDALAARDMCHKSAIVEVST
jgi:hypothetical protein